MKAYFLMTLKMQGFTNISYSGKLRGFFYNDNNIRKFQSVNYY